jgi:hypothetical protein
LKRTGGLDNPLSSLSRGSSIKAAYGKALLKQLAKELTLLHGKGVSRSNLYRMRQFYILYLKFQTSGISPLLTYPDERSTFHLTMVQW